MAGVDDDLMQLMKNTKGLQISLGDMKLLNTIHQYIQLPAVRLGLLDASKSVEEPSPAGHEAPAVNFQISARRKQVTAQPGPAFLLVQAAGVDNMSQLRECLRRCSDPNAQPPGLDGWTALHSAVANGHIENARALYKHGRTPLNPNIKCHGIGWTPLHYAVEFRRFEIIKFLCECCGANVFIRDWMGLTAEEMGWRNHRETVASQKKAEQFLSNLDSARKASAQNTKRSLPANVDRMFRLLRTVRIMALSRCLLLVMAHLKQTVLARRGHECCTPSRDTLLCGLHGLRRIFVQKTLRFLY